MCCYISINNLLKYLPITYIKSYEIESSTTALVDHEFILSKTFALEAIVCLF